MTTATIAIDGPVASGKSAVGAALAGRLGYRFLDTGAMYRALTWSVLENGIDPTDERAVSELTQRVSLEVLPAPDNGQAAIVVNGRDATPFLTTLRVERAVSLVSSIPAVREAMVAIQRRIAGDGGIVMVGRDIGTVVLPEADLKVYLDASASERAKRRHQQNRDAGADVEFDAILSDLRRRDEIDSGRELSPLRPAPDATIVNTDGLTLDQVVERVTALLS